MGRYRMVAEWQVDAAPEDVWVAILRHRDWPTWWKGFKTSEVLADGDASGVGTRIRQAWRSLLPYTLRFDLEIVRVEQVRVLEGRATGDVEGTATWTFASAGAGTTVRFTLDVRTTRAWMNVPAPYAGTVFRLNFDAVMRWGAAGLGRLLGANVVDRTALARLAVA